jgi:hypothetical protein
MNNNQKRESDGYIYNSHRNIRTVHNLEKAYYSRNGTYLTFILNVQHKLNDGKWYDYGIRWLVCEDDIEFVMNNGFKDFPSIFK